ncbi:2TM domain-containing protein [Ramlibacter sp. USB13]|uniref:2TM domain-containing protein n=1 Tax=Ramlibacter cellulosilyticus TaxID=2764187 RepID=A0A923S9X7_9BURK|nr:2TM domain-containing protein [Ramlibacter cellulosilyticus]MBC5782141.1 2TM domain-containing protein [Ramlibacter cellulosilyticus]
MQTYDPSIEQQARRRAGAKMGWFIHAAVYIAVNTMLAALSAMGDRHWAIYPALGWGLGLAIHGVVVFVVTGGGGLQQRLVEQERRKLQASRDPW